MLASITPLGERSRNSRWGVTVTAFALGSTAAGLAAGAALGAAGAPLRAAASPSARLWIMGALLGVALAFESGLLRPLPTLRRQVNEQWLHRYRGWVYGAGFGIQLGAGVATIVSTSAVYCVLASAVLLGSPPRFRALAPGRSGAGNAGSGPGVPATLPSPRAPPTGSSAGNKPRALSSSRRPAYSSVSLPKSLP